MLSSNKITVKYLAYLLGVTTKTASKEYKIMLSSLNTKRNFLILSDLKIFDIDVK